MKDFKFELKQVNPRKLTEIINKTNIVIVSSNRGWSWTLYIRKYKIQRIIRLIKRLRIGQLVALSLLTRITYALFIGLRNKRKFMLAKDTLDY
jgi:hypothetical protein